METQIHVTLVKHAAVCGITVQTVRLVLAKGVGARTHIGNLMSLCCWYRWLRGYVEVRASGVYGGRVIGAWVVLAGVTTDC